VAQVQVKYSIVNYIRSLNVVKSIQTSNSINMITLGLEAIIQYYLVMTCIKKIISIICNIKELKWVDSAGDYFYWPVKTKDAGIESGKATSNSNAEVILKATASIV
jgi:hypothetical protein